MAWRPSRNQWLAIVPAAIFVAMNAAAGAWINVGLLVVLAGVVVWQMEARRRPPEKVEIKSVKCGGCGAVGEPHWAKCPKCGAADWKVNG